MFLTRKTVFEIWTINSRDGRLDPSNCALHPCSVFIHVVPHYITGYLTIISGGMRKRALLRARIFEHVIPTYHPTMRGLTCNMFLQYESFIL